ncbi:alpha/beta-hydrolase [Daldinia caldariorum]|uniref:alpha/beta-hydrolase n=1 Tax=Daldinia caldariorum TaxID=326644 RepID=UPI002008AF35|nr:alpha/beta-hydrolase [Daldinia caldariorum]KAI1463154.1 alpha/beta-hydrolase [Daldinia caldariorum]
MIRQIFLLGFLALANAAKVMQDLPTLKLPWGTWQATVYEEDDKIYLFRNVRFGAPPERFGRPSFPDEKSDALQTIAQDISCIQLDTSSMKNPPGGDKPIGDPRNDDVLETEDCLFLDVYVPVSAFGSDITDLLPVIVWINGGAYAAGSKNPSGPIASGRSILNASEYQTIFIEGNYRLGAFGWLAGDYMQQVGQPNAGLYDQALLFEWAQEYVELVKGDKDRVTAWGESAGAGSVLHHLIREDGTKDPLFRTFAIQSPAFQWAWDNSPGGTLDTVYRNFSDFAGCGFEFDIDCLRKAPEEDLRRANQLIFRSFPLTGLFPVGPAVDGGWVNKFWHDIDSAIISHCANESFGFTPVVTNETEFDQILENFFPGSRLKPQRDAVKEYYNCEELYDGDFYACLSAIVRESSFTCNTRDLFEAYPAESYMMRYSFPQSSVAFHASDLYPLFTKNAEEVIAALNGSIGEENATLYANLLYGLKIPEAYKNYFASFALTGDPNEGLLSPPYEQWPVANGSSELLSNVMKVSLIFSLTTDDQNSKSNCSFWTEIAKELSGGLEGHGGMAVQTQVLSDSLEL